MLRGNELRADLRRILAVPMPLPPEPEEAAGEPAAEVKSRGRPRGAVSSAQQREAARGRQNMKLQREMAMRPVGCETRSELAKRRSVHPDTMSQWLAKKGIKARAKIGSIAWYHVKQVRRAGLIA